jgi:hypothetical protein
MAVVMLLLAAADGRGQTLDLRIEEGLVYLDARGVSVKRILERWVDLRGTVLVGAATLPNDPVTLRLDAVSEAAALHVLLRNTTGYILGSRPGTGPFPAIDRILVVNGSGDHVPRVAVAPPTSAPQALSYSTTGERQVGLDGPEQRLVDISEGLIDQEALPPATATPKSAPPVGSRFPGMPSPLPQSARPQGATTELPARGF